MANPIELISINWTDENGQQLVKELKKEVLTSGAWSTIMFMYQDLDKQSGSYGPKKVRVGRYKKSGDKYIQQSKFNISSAAQAKKIVEVIQGWLPEMESES
ncbi:MAG: hypothetical protein Q8Q33_01800 [Chlamydiota bacterium]|nr:hypothetical protein [Chlamydiota bacterium]